MEKMQIAEQLKRLLNNELDDCDRALKSGQLTRAKRELEDAMDKIRRILREM